MLKITTIDSDNVMRVYHNVLAMRDREMVIETIIGRENYRLRDGEKVVTVVYMRVSHD